MGGGDCQLPPEVDDQILKEWGFYLKLRDNWQEIHPAMIIDFVIHTDLETLSPL